METFTYPIASKIFRALATAALITSGVATANAEMKISGTVTTKVGDGLIFDLGPNKNDGLHSLTVAHLTTPINAKTNVGLVYWNTTPYKSDEYAETDVIANVSRKFKVAGKAVVLTGALGKYWCHHPAQSTTVQAGNVKVILGQVEGVRLSADLNYKHHPGFEVDAYRASITASYDITPSLQFSLTQKYLKVKKQLQPMRSVTVTNPQITYKLSKKFGVFVYGDQAISHKFGTVRGWGVGAVYEFGGK